MTRRQRVVTEIEQKPVYSCRSFDSESTLVTYIDRVIKEVWKKDIRHDYYNGYFLQEDTLKNALYYHLRQRLNRLLKDEGLRIFTEFNSGPLAGRSVRADLAIVKIDDNGEENLRDQIVKVFALIELKYKNRYVFMEPFQHDVHKALSLIKKKGLRDCQFYLGFIHEYGYEPGMESWLTVREQDRASGRLTELSACHYTDREDLRFTVVSYNGMNGDLNDSF